jgi:hypothetical protein
MAADSLVSVEDARPYRTSKLVRLYDGSIAAACGTGYEFLMAWLKGGEIAGNEPPHLEKQDFQILRLKPDGLWMYVNSYIPDRTKEKMAAIGSGSNVAFYCMKYLKKTPGAAVKESIKVSPGCGGPVEVMRLRKN